MRHEKQKPRGKKGEKDAFFITGAPKTPPRFSFMPSRAQMSQNDVVFVEVVVSVGFFSDRDQGGFRFGPSLCNSNLIQMIRVSYKK